MGGYKRAAQMFALLSLLALVSAQKGKPAPSGVKRNVVLIITDDQGYADIGFRDPTFKTPNLDALASDGVILEKLYTYTSCSPTRASLLTGRSLNNIGLQDGAVSGVYSSNSSTDFCMQFITAEDRSLSTEFPLIAETLRNSGYNTVGIGKVI
jgi:arylsulfatase A-like enzyme